MNPLANTIATGTNNQRPNALQTNSGITKVNPIYDGGPVYDSCGGETLRGLFTNTSTPSTPNTPLDDSTARYIFPPPELPPPRTATYCTIVDPSTPTEDKRDLSGDSKNEKFAGQSETDTKKEFEISEYMMMQPARDFKASPLLIST